jgi:peptidoglycan-associated lipoprotein
LAAIAFVMLAALVMAQGCAKRPGISQVSAPAPSQPAIMRAPATGATATAPEAPGTTPGFTPGQATMRPGDFEANPALATIHFDFDRSDIRPQDAKILDDNASWLRAHPQHLVLIQGHCDERGTNEYNVALGDRRATAAREYLVTHGVAPGRISIISYGEERPQCTERSEGCWARNRRGQFLTRGQ